MKRILALLVAAGVSGCSAGLTQAGSVWPGSRVPAGVDDFGFAEEEEGGLAGRFIARLGMSLYPGTKDNPDTPGADEQRDPRITLGVGYTMTLDIGDVEVGFDFVPDAKDGFNNVYFNLRGDYVYWLGESGFAATGGLGLFFERNVMFEKEEVDGGKLYGSVFFHIDIGAMYLIPEQAFDLRMALQLPVANSEGVKAIILMSANYAF